jgi:hypothetical protein
VACSNRARGTTARGIGEVGSRIHGMDESGVRLSYPPPLNIAMKHGYYSDNEIPKSVTLNQSPISDYTVNSFGYRCPEWTPLPDGKKNVVVLGCSHTFGEGLDDSEVWVEQLAAKTDPKVLRWWNLGQPGASADLIVRILYGTEKVIFPKIIIICWPVWSRRERLENSPRNLTSDNELLKTETSETDQQNFLKNVFFAEKFAEKQGAKILHCFAQDIYEVKSTYVFADTSLQQCWPEWDSHHLPDAKREHITMPSLARDGVHYGVEHHRVFAKKFYSRFKSKLM